MTLPVSVERSVAIVRRRYRIILVGGAICSVFAFLMGLLTPYLYRSDALVEIPYYVRMNENRYYQESNDVFKAASLVRSPQNLMRVAKSLIKEQAHSVEAAIPHSFSTVDVGMRMRIFNRALPDENGKKPPMQRFGANTSPKTLASLLSRHISVETDGVLRTLRITYEAGTTEAAQDICKKVVNGFIDLTRDTELQELKRQEEYLEKSIQQQLVVINRTEGKMQRLVEQYPQLSAARSNQTGTSLVAQQYLSKKDVLGKLTYELDANTRMLSDIRNNLVGQKDVVSKITSDVTGKIVDEISELEFKRLQLMRISGYDEKHPKMVDLNNRLRTLKEILIRNETDGFDNGVAKLGPDGKPRFLANQDSRNFKSLYRKKAELTEKNRQLALQKKALQEELKDEKNTFKKIVDVNFRFDSHSRELTANTAIANELFRDLQRTRLVIAGTPSQVTVLSPPTQPLYSSNISVKRRTFFGFFVGSLAILTLLLFVDFFFPILITPRDPENIGLRSFGLFDQSRPDSFKQVAACMLSLKQKKQGPLAVGFLPGCTFRNVPAVLGKITKELREIGGRLTVLAVVSDDDYTDTIMAHSDNAPIRKISYTDALASLPETIEECKQHSDWVLVIVPPNENVALEPFLAKSVSHFFYVMSLGHTNLADIQASKERILKETRVEHIALVFNQARPKVVPQLPEQGAA